MAEAKAVKRPLSPHLQIYRWSWTMLMSTLHRLTGVALYGGTFLLAVWLVAIAAGPTAFDTAQWFFGSPIGLSILFLYTWALMHHMLGGIRHFVWDFAVLMEPEQRMLISKMTLIGSIVLTVLIWVVAFATR